MSWTEPRAVTRPRSFRLEAAPTMSDDRYTFVHARLDSVRHLAEDDFSFDLPDEGEHFLAS